MICLNTLCLVFHQRNAGWERCFKTEGEMQTSRSSRNSSDGYRNFMDCSLVVHEVPSSRPGLKCLSLMCQARRSESQFQCQFQTEYSLDGQHFVPFLTVEQSIPFYGFFLKCSLFFIHYFLSLFSPCLLPIFGCSVANCCGFKVDEKPSYQWSRNWQLVN